jgi:hypothetical protein
MHEEVTSLHGLFPLAADEDDPITRLIFERNKIPFS